VYQVTGFTPAGNIRLDNDWIISKDFAHLAHGYVATSHAAQGRTVDVTLLAMGNQSLPAMGSEQFYVSAASVPRFTSKTRKPFARSSIGMTPGCWPPNWSVGPGKAYAPG
jgi:D-alanyl-D-alanine dipeptidase